MKFKHTSKVPAEKTAGEIMKILGELGANEVSMELEDRRPVGMKFRVKLGEHWRVYRMPIRLHEVSRTMKQERQDSWRANHALPDGWEEEIEEQALRSAWRIALTWLQAMLSYVETGAGTADEVFLAHLLTKDGSTLGERAQAGDMDEIILLTGGDE